MLRYVGIYARQIQVCIRFFVRTGSQWSRSRMVAVIASYFSLRLISPAAATDEGMGWTAQTPSKDAVTVIHAAGDESKSYTADFFGVYLCAHACVCVCLCVCVCVCACMHMWVRVRVVCVFVCALLCFCVSCSFYLWVDGALASSTSSSLPLTMLQYIGWSLLECCESLTLCPTIINWRSDIKHGDCTSAKYHL